MPPLSSNAMVPDRQEDHTEKNPSVVHDVEMPNIAEDIEPVGEDAQT